MAAVIAFLTVFTIGAVCWSDVTMTVVAAMVLRCQEQLTDGAPIARTLGNGQDDAQRPATADLKDALRWRVEAADQSF